VTAVLDPAARAFLTRHRVARLATADAAGTPHVIPFCYALARGRIYFVVDAKPKRRTGLGLKRMRNIAENSAVAMVADDYAENWNALAYLLVRGQAEVVTDAGERRRALRALRSRYPRYRSMALDGPEHPVVRITPHHVHFWQAASPNAVTPRGGGARSAPRGAARRRRTSPLPRARRSRR
jgi:PPOX class probable F420-dependent enzyme